MITLWSPTDIPVKFISICIISKQFALKSIAPLKNGHLLYGARSERSSS